MSVIFPCGDPGGDCLHHTGVTDMQDGFCIAVWHGAIASKMRLVSLSEFLHPCLVSGSRFPRAAETD